MNSKTLVSILCILFFVQSPIALGDEEPVSVDDLDHLCREVFADAGVQIHAFTRYLEDVQSVEAGKVPRDVEIEDRLRLDDVEVQVRILSYMEQLLSYYRSSSRARADTRRDEMKKLGQVLVVQRARVLALRKGGLKAKVADPGEIELKMAQEQIAVMGDPEASVKAKMAALTDYWKVLHQHASVKGNDKSQDATLLWMIGVSKIHLCQKVAADLSEKKVAGAENLAGRFGDLRKRIEESFRGLGFSQFESYYFGYKEVLDEDWVRVELDGRSPASIQYESISVGFGERLEGLTAAEFAQRMVFRKSIIQDQLYTRFLQGVEKKIFPDAAKLIAKTRATEEIQVYYSKWLDDYIVLFDIPIGSQNTQVLWIAEQAEQWSFLPQRKVSGVEWSDAD